MATSINQAFVTQFEREVHEAFQRKGTKLRKMVRVKNNVVGSSTYFQKVAKGTATTKSRHGIIPAMNVTHTSVQCTMADYYAGDWVDKLDEAKVNHDERRVLANAGAYALGRKVDSQIITAMDTTTNTIAHGSAAFTEGKILTGLETLGDLDVFEDGRMWCIVNWNAWTDLLTLEEFRSSDQVGDNYPWLSNTESKKWLGTIWMPTSVLSELEASSTFYSFWFHEDSIGHGVGAEISTDITWHGDRAAHWVNHMMSQGSCMIDVNGCLEIAHQ